MPSLQIVLRHLPGRFVYVDHLCLLRFDGLPLPLPPPALQRARGDIPAMAACQGKPEALFERRFAVGNRAVVALVGGNIVGYEWYCVDPVYDEDTYKFRIEIPPHGIYAFDAYIRPEYRLRGVWIWFKKYLAELMGEHSWTSVVAFVDFNNAMSLNTHLRYGFVPYRGVWVIRVFDRRWAIEHTIQAKNQGKRFSAVH